jgi:hypothetical protein
MGHHGQRPSWFGATPSPQVPASSNAPHLRRSGFPGGLTVSSGAAKKYAACLAGASTSFVPANIRLRAGIAFGLFEAGLSILGLVLVTALRALSATLLRTGSALPV